MGCLFSESKDKKLIENKKQGFVIKIKDPFSKNIHYFKYFDEKQKSDLFMNVMNGLCFSEKVSEKVDGNFVSYYDAEEDRFCYYVERLLGTSIQHPGDPKSGKMWVPYINEKRQDWDQLVEHNTRVTIHDNICWKYETCLKDKERKK